MIGYCVLSDPTARHCFTVTVTEVLCTKLPAVPVSVKVNVPFVSEFLAKLMFTVVADGVDPFKVTEVGEMLHCEVDGPAHVSNILPVNPPTGVSVTVNLADFPIAIVSEAGVAEIVKSATGAATVISTSALSVTGAAV